MSSTVRTPTCPSCGTKFPGDPCKKCHKGSVEAREQKAHNMPGATRKRVKHGRKGVARGQGSKKQGVSSDGTGGRYREWRAASVERARSVRS